MYDYTRPCHNRTTTSQFNERTAVSYCSLLTGHHACRTPHTPYGGVGVARGGGEDPVWRKRTRRMAWHGDAVLGGPGDAEAQHTASRRSAKQVQHLRSPVLRLMIAMLMSTSVSTRVPFARGIRPGRRRQVAAQAATKRTPRRYMDRYCNRYLSQGRPSKNIQSRMQRGRE